MNHSLSHAENGGGKHILLCAGMTAGDKPTVKYKQAPEDVLPENARHGWTLASSLNDLDGDQLPELYLANDFGPDRMLYNESTPGHVKFTNVTTDRTPGTPKSKRIGNDSFKGMGVDFGDFNHDGLWDAFVSNLTEGWGIVESNFQYVNTAKNQKDLRDQLGRAGAGTTRSPTSRTPVSPTSR